MDLAEGQNSLGTGGNAKKKASRVSPGLRDIAGVKGRGGSDARARFDRNGGRP